MPENFAVHPPIPFLTVKDVIMGITDKVQKALDAPIKMEQTVKLALVISVIALIVTGVFVIGMAVRNNAN
jgi:hypothetical protein